MRLHRIASALALMLSLQACVPDAGGRTDFLVSRTKLATEEEFNQFKNALEQRFISMGGVPSGFTEQNIEKNYSFTKNGSITWCFVFRTEELAIRVRCSDSWIPTLYFVTKARVPKQHDVFMVDIGNFLNH